MATKLTPEERLRRAVAKATRASDRAYTMAWRAWRDWRAAGCEADMLARDSRSDSPAIVVEAFISTRVTKAREVENAACDERGRANELARLMGVEAP
jgi:hypothetical protein